MKWKLGKKLGSGWGRVVYEYAKDPKYVVKVHRKGVIGCNWREWYIWQAYPQYRKYLAPCKKISSCGTYLLQRRGKKAGKRPKEFPATFHDIAKSNWVVIDGKIVMCDYANRNMYKKVTGRDYDKAEEEKIRTETFNRKGTEKGDSSTGSEEDP